MSGGRGNNSSEEGMIDLQLNLSQPNRDSPVVHVQSPSNTSSSSTVSSSIEIIMSPESSCVSSEVSSHTNNEYSSAGSGSPPEAILSPMMLVGCPRCLMYVMLSDVDPKCPQCKSTVFLDFLSHELTKRAIN